MPYTKVGRWQPLEWFEENGVDVPADYDAADEQLRVVRRSFRDPTDEELVAAWQDYYGLMQTRRQQEAEVQAENDRLMELERQKSWKPSTEEPKKTPGWQSRQKSQELSCSPEIRRHSSQYDLHSMKASLPHMLNQSTDCMTTLQYHKLTAEEKVQSSQSQRL
jgi:hypothetical protein